MSIFLLTKEKQSFDDSYGPLKTVGGWLDNKRATKFAWLCNSDLPVVP